MAASVPEYVDPLLRQQQAWATLLGSGVLRTGQETYNLNLTVLAILGVIMKALNDKGTVTDAEWLQRLGAVAGDPWPAWILNQTPPPGS